MSLYKVIYRHNKKQNQRIYQHILNLKNKNTNYMAQTKLLLETGYIMGKGNFNRINNLIFLTEE